MTDEPAGGLPSPEPSKITDPVEIGVFTFGSATAYLTTFILTHDLGTSAAVAPMGGAFTFSLKRIGVAAAKSITKWKRPKKERARLLDQVRWQIRVLQDISENAAIAPFQMQSLRELSGIEDMPNPSLDVIRTALDSVRLREETPRAEAERRQIARDHDHRELE